MQRRRRLVFLRDRCWARRLPQAQLFASLGAPVRVSSSVRVCELPENLLLHIVLDFVEYDIVKLDHPQHHVIGSHNHVMNDESFDQVEYNHVSFQFSYLMELFLNLIQLKDVDAVRLSMNYLDDEENHDSNILRTIQY